MQRHLVYVHSGHLLVERVLFAVRDRQVRAGLGEDREDRRGRERGYLGEQRSTHGMQHAQVVGGVDENAWEIEQSILDRSAERERCNVRSVGAPRDVVRRLVQRGRVARRNDRLVDDVVYGQHVAPVAHVVADGDASMRVAWVEQDELAHGGSFE